MIIHGILFQITLISITVEGHRRTDQDREITFKQQDSSNSARLLNLQTSMHGQPQTQTKIGIA
jgi:hypothetical protein